MMFFSILPLATTFFFLGRVRAANDWSVPCLVGQCSYDLKNDTASGSLQIVSLTIVSSGNVLYFRELTYHCPVRIL